MEGGKGGAEADRVNEEKDFAAAEKEEEGSRASYTTQSWERKVFVVRRLTSELVRALVHTGDIDTALTISTTPSPPSMLKAGEAQREGGISPFVSDEAVLEVVGALLRHAHPMIETLMYEVDARGVAFSRMTLNTALIMACRKQNLPWARFLAARRLVCTDPVGAAAGAGDTNFFAPDAWRKHPHVVPEKKMRARESIRWEEKATEEMTRFEYETFVLADRRLKMDEAAARLRTVEEANSRT